MNYTNIAIDIIVIFSLGAIAGWVIELLFQTFLTRKKLGKPGFFNGPYLPIYGFGTLFIYWIASLSLSLILKVLIFVAVANLMELVTGLFFLHRFNVRLWDYRKHPYNIKGVICPLYAAYWGFLSVIYLLFLHELLTIVTSHIKANPAYLIIFGIFYLIMFFDVLHSFSIVRKIKTLTKAKIDFRELRNEAVAPLSWFGRHFFPLTHFMKSDVFKKFQKIIKRKNNPHHLAKK